MKDTKLWADTYYDSGHHKWVGAFLSCMDHGCPTCYSKQTFNTILNMTVDDLYCETERSIERVKTCGYMYSIMWECQWDNICKIVVEIRGHVDGYSLAAALKPCDALYGGRGETFDLYDQLQKLPRMSYSVFDWTQPPWSRREFIRRIDRMLGSTTKGFTHYSLSLLH